MGRGAGHSTFAPGSMGRGGAGWGSRYSPWCLVFHSGAGLFAWLGLFILASKSALNLVSGFVALPGKVPPKSGPGACGVGPGVPLPRFWGAGAIRGQEQLSHFRPFHCLGHTERGRPLPFPSGGRRLALPSDLDNVWCAGPFPV